MRQLFEDMRTLAELVAEDMKKYARPQGQAAINMVQYTQITRPENVLALFYRAQSLELFMQYVCDNKERLGVEDLGFHRLVNELHEQDKEQAQG